MVHLRAEKISLRQKVAPRVNRNKTNHHAATGFVLQFDSGEFFGEGKNKIGERIRRLRPYAKRFAIENGCLLCASALIVS
jgi:hypothetical protein